MSRFTLPSFLASPAAAPAPAPVLGRRAFSASLAGALLVSLADPADAAVSVMMSLGELVDQSDRVVVGTAVERKSQWEEIQGGKRIVTYTRVAIDETMTGGATDSETWVRTLGGVVGKIGQSVSGEASLAIDAPSLLFLTRVLDDGSISARAVLGMAQGHYPITEVDGERRLVASPDAGKLLPRRGPTISAREALVGRPVNLARVDILDTARRLGKALPKKAK